MGHKYYYCLNMKWTMLSLRKEGDEMWLNIMLAIVVLVGMTYGMYLMFRVDCFVQENNNLQDQSEIEAQKDFQILNCEEKKESEATLVEKKVDMA